MHSRRVGSFAEQQLVDAWRLNGLTRAYLSFFNYVEPTVWGKRSSTELTNDEFVSVGIWQRRFSEAGVRLQAIGTDPINFVDVFASPPETEVQRLGRTHMVDIPE